MSNPFDFPVDDDPQEESATSPEEEDLEEGDAEESGEDSRGEEVETPPNSRIAALERQLREKDEKLIDSLAQLAALRTKAKKEETREEKFTPEQLKQWALEQDGRRQFDAAVHYTDQKAQEVVERVQTELRRQQTQKFIREYMSELYPELKDNSSEFTRRVQLESQRILGSGDIDPDSPDSENTAYNMALHRVGRSWRSSGDENAKKFNARRRLEASGAEGAPARGSDERKTSEKATQEELSIAANMGVDLRDKETLQRFRTLQKYYSNMRSVP